MSKISDREEFVHVMTLEYPHLPGLLGTLRKIMRLAATRQRLAVEACNRQLSPREERRQDATRASLGRLCTELPGCGIITSGDPRGSVVKLVVPSGRTNDWGGEGICVPS